MGLVGPVEEQTMDQMWSCDLYYSPNAECAAVNPSFSKKQTESPS